MEYICRLTVRLEARLLVAGVAGVQMPPEVC